MAVDIYMAEYMSHIYVAYSTCSIYKHMLHIFYIYVTYCVYTVCMHHICDIYGIFPTGSKGKKQNLFENVLSNEAFYLNIVFTFPEFLDLFRVKKNFLS